MPQHIGTAGITALTLALTAIAAKGEDQHWDIENPPGDTHEVRIDTTEGTWVSVDVSPDGKLIAFDLLGDLYLMPIGGSADGGAVTKLTTGMAWDMQPRFSPDGRAIAFTSDRLGASGKSGDNIWTLGIGADDAWGTDDDAFTQITNETYRLLNGPAWHRSGGVRSARARWGCTPALAWMPGLRVVCR